MYKGERAMAVKSFAEKLKRLFGIHTRKDDSFFEELTDVMIEGDLGAKTAMELTDALEAKSRREHISDEAALLAELKHMLLGFVKGITIDPDPDKIHIFLVLGVNGVGKTTTVAKLANYFEGTGRYNVVMAAADTFRAAAIDQLLIHGERLGIRVVAHQHGSDPAAVVFDAADSIAAKGGGIVFADTAGRLHNKENLVRELQKIDRVASSKASPDCYHKLLVIDGTTGQNALRQAEVFHEAIGIDAFILTKYDSTAKGGAVVSICKELGIPAAFICNGERYQNISAFDADSYVSSFLGLSE